MNDLFMEMCEELKDVSMSIVEPETNVILGLCDIPMRVVVTKIFPFSQLKLHQEYVDKYGLFGVFKRDRFRNVFFLFSSLYIKNEAPSCIIDYGRVRNLELKILPKWYMELIITISPYFRNLECLSLRGVKTSITRELFSQESCFPNLSNFILDQDIVGSREKIDVTKWSCRTHLFNNNIKRLSLTRHGTGDDGEFVAYNLNFFHFLVKMKSLSNIFSLTLCNIKLNDRVTLKLPKLTDLSLSNCQGIIIIPGDSTIRSLSFYLIDYKQIQYYYVLSPKLKCLDISLPEPISNDNNTDDNDENFSDISWMFESTTQFTRLSELQRLEKLTVQRLTWSNKSCFRQLCFWDNFFCNSIREIQIVRVKNFPFSVFGRLRIPLKYLCLVDTTTECRSLPLFPFSKYLNRLEIIDTYPTFDDSFFEECDWNNLEYLHLVCNEYQVLRGKKWKKMEKLKILKLNNCVLLDDRFFEFMNFKELKELEIILSPSFTSKIGWKSFTENLKRLEIRQCNGIDESLFTSHEFGSLEDLYLEALEGITGKNWNKSLTKNLKNLRVMFCVEYCDEFLKNDFRWLRNVLLVDCGFLTGENWGKMPCLRMIEAREYVLKRICESSQHIERKIVKMKGYYL